MKISKLLILYVLLLAGCSDEGAELVNDGEITLSSEFIGSDNFYYRLGYSFEKTKFYAIPAIKENEFPEVFLEDIPVPGSEDFIAFIYSETTRDNKIFKNGDFSQLGEAETFFNEYDNVVEGSWSTLSDTLEKYQVYTFKTFENNYVKLLILDVRVYNNVSVPDYMEVDIRFFIQRNGSRSFLEQ